MRIHWFVAFYAVFKAIHSYTYDKGADDPLSTVMFETVYGEVNNMREIKGFEPTVSKSQGFPVYIWITGTGMCKSGEWGDLRENIDNTFTREMASRGFVAAAVDYECNDYPSICSKFSERTRSLFSMTENSAMKVICNRPYANCTKGIAVHGFSQGANIASMSDRYNPYVSSVLLFGNGDTIAGTKRENKTSYETGCLRYGDHSFEPPRRLGKSHFRSLAGEWDQYFGGSKIEVIKQQQGSTGFDCKDDTDCINKNGSGYFVVRDQPHGFFYDTDIQLTNQFSKGNNAWHMTPGFDWLENSINNSMEPDVNS